jgi:hypothetical protein
MLLRASVVRFKRGGVEGTLLQKFEAAYKIVGDSITTAKKIENN